MAWRQVVELSRGTVAQHSPWVAETSACGSAGYQQTNGHVWGNPGQRMAVKSNSAHTKRERRRRSSHNDGVGSISKARCRRQIRGIVVVESSGRQAAESLVSLCR